MTEYLIGDFLHTRKRESKSAVRDRIWLLSGLLNKTHAELFLSQQEKLSKQDYRRLQNALLRRKRGEPLQYILGETEFFGRRFFVDRRVLIPRPETERLVELALENIPNKSLRILDLGTGSGAIAITSVLERPQWKVTASDISPAALVVAKKNANKHGAKLRLLSANLLNKPLSPTHFDWVISNPPYLDLAKDFVAKDVRRFEPGIALQPRTEERLKNCPERAAWLAERILLSCAACVAPPAGVLLELSPRIAYYLERKWRSHSAVEELQRLPDLAGRRRFLLVRWRKKEVAHG